MTASNSPSSSSSSSTSTSVSTFVVGGTAIASATAAFFWIYRMKKRRVRNALAEAAGGSATAGKASSPKAKSAGPTGSGGSGNKDKEKASATSSSSSSSSASSKKKRSAGSKQEPTSSALKAGGRQGETSATTTTTTTTSRGISLEASGGSASRSHSKSSTSKKKKKKRRKKKAASSGAMQEEQGLGGATTTEDEDDDDDDDDDFDDDDDEMEAYVAKNQEQRDGTTATNTTNATNTNTATTIDKITATTTTENTNAAAVGGTWKVATKRRTKAKKGNADVSTATTTTRNSNSNNKTAPAKTTSALSLSLSLSSSNDENSKDVTTTTKTTMKSRSRSVSPFLAEKQQPQQPMTTATAMATTAAAATATATKAAATPSVIPRKAIPTPPATFTSVLPKTAAWGSVAKQQQAGGKVPPPFLVGLQGDNPAIRHDLQDDEYPQLQALPPKQFLPKASDDDHDDDHDDDDGGDGDDEEESPEMTTTTDDFVSNRERELQVQEDEENDEENDAGAAIAAAVAAAVVVPEEEDDDEEDDLTATIQESHDRDEEAWAPREEEEEKVAVEMKSGEAAAVEVTLAQSPPPTTTTRSLSLAVETMTTAMTPGASVVTKEEVAKEEEEEEEEEETIAIETASPPSTSKINDEDNDEKFSSMQQEESAVATTTTTADDEQEQAEALVSSVIAVATDGAEKDITVDAAAANDDDGDNNERSPMQVEEPLEVSEDTVEGDEKATNETCSLQETETTMTETMASAANEEVLAATSTTTVEMDEKEEDISPPRPVDDHYEATQDEAEEDKAVIEDDDDKEEPQQETEEDEVPVLDDTPVDPSAPPQPQGGGDEDPDSDVIAEKEEVEKEVIGVDESLLVATATSAIQEDVTMTTTTEPVIEEGAHGIPSPLPRTTASPVDDDTGPPEEVKIQDVTQVTDEATEKREEILLLAPQADEEEDYLVEDTVQEEVQEQQATVVEEPQPTAATPEKGESTETTTTVEEVVSAAHVSEGEEGATTILESEKTEISPSGMKSETVEIITQEKEAAATEVQPNGMGNAETAQVLEEETRAIEENVEEIGEDQPLQADDDDSGDDGEQTANEAATANEKGATDEEVPATAVKEEEMTPLEESQEHPSVEVEKTMDGIEASTQVQGDAMAMSAEAEEVVLCEQEGVEPQREEQARNDTDAANSVEKEEGEEVPVEPADLPEEEGTEHSEVIAGAGVGETVGETEPSNQESHDDGQQEGVEGEVQLQQEGSPSKDETTTLEVTGQVPPTPNDEPDDSQMTLEDSSNGGTSPSDQVAPEENEAHEDGDTAPKVEEKKLPVEQSDEGKVEDSSVGMDVRDKPESRWSDETNVETEPQNKVATKEATLILIAEEERLQPHSLDEQGEGIPEDGNKVVEGNLQKDTLTRAVDDDHEEEDPTSHGRIRSEPQVFADDISGGSEEIEVALTVTNNEISIGGVADLQEDPSTLDVDEQEPDQDNNDDLNDGTSKVEGSHTEVSRAATVPDEGATDSKEQAYIALEETQGEIEIVTQIEAVSSEADEIKPVTVNDEPEAETSAPSTEESDGVQEVHENGSNLDGSAGKLEESLPKPTEAENEDEVGSPQEVDKRAATESEHEDSRWGYASDDDEPESAAGPSGKDSENGGKEIDFLSPVTTPMEKLDDYTEDTEMFLQSLPKVELHVHLDGAFSPEVMWNFLKEQESNSLDGPSSMFQHFPVESQLPWKTLPVRQAVMECSDVAAYHDLCTCRGERSLHSMLECFEFFLPVVRGNLGLLEELSYDFCRRQAQQRVMYTEVRYSPHLLAKGATLQLPSQDEASTTPKENPRPVLEAVTRGLRRGCQDFNVIVNQILCCIAWRPDWAMQVVELCDEHRDDFPCAVVGLDIASGEEHYDTVNYPQLNHESAMKRAQELNLRITLHAGEVGDADNVVTAIHQYGAKRIGHGYRLLHRPPLLQQLVAQGTHVECCPTSSFETGGWDFDREGSGQSEKDWEQHPINAMLKVGMSVGLNSDDPAVFDTSLTWQFRIASAKMKLSPFVLVQSIRNSIDAAFCPFELKEQLRERLDAYWRLHQSGRANNNGALSPNISFHDRVGEDIYVDLYDKKKNQPETET